MSDEPCGKALCDEHRAGEVWRALEPTTVCDEHTEFLGALRPPCISSRDERERRTKLRRQHPRATRELATNPRTGGHLPENWRASVFFFSKKKNLDSDGWAIGCERSSEDSGLILPLLRNMKNSFTSLSRMRNHI